jgi:hypothetical protein
MTKIYTAAVGQNGDGTWHILKVYLFEPSGHREWLDKRPRACSQGKILEWCCRYDENGVLEWSYVKRIQPLEENDLMYSYYEKLGRTRQIRRRKGSVGARVKTSLAPTVKFHGNA